MQIVLSAEDFQDAPESVHSWLSGRLGFSVAPVTVDVTESVEVVEAVNDSEATTTKAKPKTKKDEPKPEPPDPAVVLKKAIELVNAKGEDVLAEVLKNVGIARVRECPEDKLADLLAEIAVHA
jgi:hypothetical protein